jgi:hypothetical protein
VLKEISLDSLISKAILKVQRIIAYGKYTRLLRDEMSDLSSKFTMQCA